MNKYDENDFIGVKFGKITIVKYLGTIKKEKTGDNHKFWLGKCKCGTEMNLTANEIIKTARLCCKNCSKPHLTHGLTNTRLFNIWQSMKERCYNPNNKNYYLYGRRNIKLCKEWLGKNGFINFFNWAINNGYKSNLTIDRINVNDGYNPQNCRWATVMEQTNNKRNNIIIEWNGIKDTLPNWSRKVGISVACLQSRYYKGWDVDKMLTEKPQIGRNQYLCRKVKCIETNLIFNNMGEAQKVTGIRKTSIWAVCNNRNKTAGGYLWTYI